MKKKCPSCNKPVDPENTYHPFCSDRCRLIDLGGWLDENYRINDREDHELFLAPEEDRKTTH